MLACDHCSQPTDLKDFGQFNAEAKICSACCRKARLANAELAKRKPVEVEVTAYDLFHNAAEDSPPSDDHEFDRLADDRNPHNEFGEGIL